MRKKNIQNAIIWRESIYKNSFKCKCGEKLGDLDGRPSDELMVNANDFTDNRLFCPKCMLCVAFTKKVPSNLPDDGKAHLQGNWNDKVEQYEKDFREAENSAKELKEKTKELNRKLSAIAELESKVRVLENRLKNKDVEIERYSFRLKDLTREYEALEHRMNEVLQMKGCTE